MAYDDLASPVPPRHEIPHYYGDAVRAIFVVESVLIIVGTFMRSLPGLSVFASVASAIALVVVAGVMNPAQAWVHWVGAALAAGGAALFGSMAYGAATGGTPALDASLLFALALAILSLVALYLATKTIRGRMLRP